MREQEFKARDKKVRKMTRDGLVEQNLTQGTQQRISNRIEDVSFGHEKTEDTAVGRQSRGKKQKPAEGQAERFDNASAPEIWTPKNVPVSMREADDKPMVVPGGTSDTCGSSDKNLRGKQQRHEGGAKARESETDINYINIKTKDKTAELTTGTGRLRFDAKEMPDTDRKNRAKLKKGQAAKFSGNAGSARTESKDADAPNRGRLRFEHDTSKDDAKSKDRTVLKKRQALKFSADDAKPEDAPRLQYTPGENKKDGTGRENTTENTTENTADNTNKDSAHTDSAGTDTAAQEKRGRETGKSRQKYEKSQRRVEKAERKLEEAQENLQTRRRATFRREFDPGTGKAKRRLRFETGVIPRDGKPPLIKRAGGAAGNAVKTTAVLKVHQKIREAERDNAGVEAAHKIEFTVERAVGRGLRWNRQRLHEKPCRAVQRAERHLVKANADMAYQKFLQENPQLQKKALSKHIQKQKLKRKYAAAAREAAKNTRHTTNLFTVAGQTARSQAQAVAAHKTVFGIIAMGVLVIALFGAMFSSCTSMLAGVQSAVVSSCYVADDAAINQSELYYTELETDLQIDISNTETDYSDYDEYRYSISEIAHNPYELMGYLSAAYDDFTYAQAEPELERIFGLQYSLTREETTETRTRTDDEGNEEEYEWKVLTTTLSVQPLSDIIAADLTPGEQTDRYGVYMTTCGNRQCYSNPFDFAWLPYVTSPYGYRIHPISGGKDLHRGIDIGVAEGTPIKAAQDGRVLSAGDAGSYGLCVVIEGGDGYQSKYAHCSAILVSPGQEVRRGDMIAKVGNTGNSTGAHLHLEVTQNGEYLNPYYFVDNGTSGYTPDGGTADRPDFPDDPGDALEDDRFAAMLEEAEKYLGYPYVWGGSSPSMSFDCSGYVSWVINHCGWSVGRQTAQGLFNLCTPVSRENLQPGDLVFFTGTYSSANPVTHVGIYVGGNRMLHCGDPIAYASLVGYWDRHWYSGGRLP